MSGIDPGATAIAVGLGGAIGSVVTGVIAAAAPWRRVALEEMQAALEEQRVQLDRQSGQIDRVTQLQIDCERERADDRAASAAAEARNLARIEALEQELQKLRDMGPPG